MTSKCRQITDAIGIYGFISAVGMGFIAYTATHAYVCFCAPTGVWGFVQSLVIMDSTFCKIILGLVHHSQSLYGAMMLSFMFSIIAGFNKSIEWATGSPAPQIPRNVQVGGVGTRT